MIVNNEFSWLNRLKPESVADVTEMEKITLEARTIQRLSSTYKLIRSQIIRVFEILLLSRLNRRAKAIKDRFKQMVAKRLRDEKEAIVRGKTVPCILINGKREPVEQKLLAEAKARLFYQESRYNFLYEQTVEKYLGVIKKLQI